jgi:hypothetical protein
MAPRRETIAKGLRARTSLLRSIKHYCLLRRCPSARRISGVYQNNYNSKLYAKEMPHAPNATKADQRQFCIRPRYQIQQFVSSNFLLDMRNDYLRFSLEFVLE